MATSKKATTPKVEEEKVVKGTPIKEEVKETPIEVKEEAPVVKEEPLPETPKAVEPNKETVKEPEVEKTMEEKIKDFYESRSAGEFKLNDFLKSLFPMPTTGTPAEYLQQGVSRQIRAALITLQNNGDISLVGERYRELGSGYYHGEEQKLRHYDITTLDIYAKK